MQLLENQRIKELINYFLNGSQRKFAVELGITEQTLGNYINGKTKVPLYVAEKIKEHYPTVNLEWLVMGVGDMLLSENESTSIVKEPSVKYHKSNTPIDINLLHSELAHKEELLTEKDLRIKDLSGQVEFLKHLLDKK